MCNRLSLKKCQINQKELKVIKQVVAILGKKRSRNEGLVYLLLKGGENQRNEKDDVGEAVVVDVPLAQSRSLL